MALNQPSKRKAAFSSQQNTAASRKRAKTYDARSLAVQSSEAALSNTGELDVSAYLNAREFEIRSLEAGMQRSKAALTSRAFQKVPRSLRRRTASHNVKRVPSRLRARAKREMIEDNTPTVTARRRKPTEIMRIRLETARRLQNLNSKTKAKRAAAKAKRNKEDQKALEEAGGHAFYIAPRVPKIKKNKLSRPPPPESKYQKRQRCKTWLPTHMWHAKRARMTTSKDPLWRFAIPLSPTEKSYRPSHRARSARGAVAWDMSYISTIQLEGTEAALESVLRAVGIDGESVWGAKGRKWKAGLRSLRAWALEQDDQRRPIAPVTLIRCAQREVEDMEMVDVDDADPGKNKRKNKGNVKIFIRVHPSAFLQLWNEFLGVSKKQNPPVMVEDLRFEIGSIEITGPGSTEALLSILRPSTAEEKGNKAASPETTWNSLLGVSNPSSLPQNALLAFSVPDPRLRFPPQRLNPPSSDKQMQDLAMLLSTWPLDKNPTPSALFDRPTRLAATRQLPSQKAINRRRTETGPGIYPPPQDSDPQIPVIITATRAASPSTSNAPGSWTVLLPWKCVPPMWYALMYYPLSSGGNPRFGGLNEQQQLAFEAGEPWFPGDFPGTQAGWEWGLRERTKAKEQWERRPKGRRIEFDSLDLGNGRKGEVGRGWACDWEVFQQPLPDGNAPENTDAPTSKGQDTGRTGSRESTKETPTKTSSPLEIRQLPPPRAKLAISDTSIDIDDTVFATVKLSLYYRGTPTPRARIYRLPTTNSELRQKWVALASKTASNGKKQQHSSFINPTFTKEDARQRLAESLFTLPDDTDAHKEHLPIPPEEDLIGFVTTGNYNLSEGKGTGIGSIQLSKVRLKRNASKSKKRESNMCIIRGAGERIGRLAVWELV